MQHRRGQTAAPSRRGGLQPLAPRSSPVSPPPESPSASGSGRAGRLSHRSRAGCWTCRGRKVKCDEQRPRCGQCSRLNRECDWEHRWNFNDATSSTQGKHSNVTTSGNFVWDPDAPQSPFTSAPRPQDNLPSFATLTTDEDRERKAETQRPGIFSVVATPESFASLPEYATAESPARARRGSTQSTQGSTPDAASPDSQVVLRSDDPTVTYIDRFEETSPVSPRAYAAGGPPPQSSMPDAMRSLSLSTSSSIVGTSSSHTGWQPEVANPDNQLILHFRRHIAPRLLQPMFDGDADHGLVSGSTRDLFELEAARSQPLYHAICALSALNLSYNARNPLQEAHQHYSDALSTTARLTTAEGLLSDGVFLSHVLLFIYDICVPMGPDHGGYVMWARHLHQLQTIALRRHQRLGQERHGFLLWLICELDLYACLLGSGDCGFVKAILHSDMLPPLSQQVPSTLARQPYLNNETRIFPVLQELNEGVVLNTVKLAQLAQACRAEAAMVQLPSPGASARWQAAVSRLQSELVAFWSHFYPDFLGPDSPEAGRNLPARPRWVFEHAFSLYQTSIIYSRTSMFPQQRTIPLANQQEVETDTERRCASILIIASDCISQARQKSSADTTSFRHMVFPVFIAGIATRQSDAKVQALELIKAMESPNRGSIGLNTYQTRRLLAAVYEEQRHAAGSGRRMEEVDWMAVGRERGFSVVNCGL